MSTPFWPLASATVPALSVPIMLPSIVFAPIDPAYDPSEMPLRPLPEIRLPAPAHRAADGVQGPAQEHAVVLVADRLVPTRVGPD